MTYQMSVNDANVQKRIENRRKGRENFEKHLHFIIFYHTYLLLRRALDEATREKEGLSGLTPSVSVPLLL